MEQPVARRGSETEDATDVLRRIEALLARIDERAIATHADLEGIKASLDEKPTRTHMWEIVGALLAAYIVCVALLAFLL
jgi:hypothetical protein